MGNINDAVASLYGSSLGIVVRITSSAGGGSVTNGEYGGGAERKSGHDDGVEFQRMRMSELTRRWTTLLMKETINICIYGVTSVSLGTVYQVYVLVEVV